TSEGRNPQSSHICYFILDPSVALWDGVFFTDTNATKTTDGHQREQGLLGLNLVDFETIMAHLSGSRVPKQRWHRNVQAECLVPDQIPLKYVKGISFISEASLREGQRLWGEANHPTFRVERDLFSIGFALVNDFKLTSQQITNENVGTLQLQDERNFSKRLCSRVTLLANIYATACSQAKIVWLDNEGNIISEDKTDFEKVSTYWHWPSLQIVNLNEGNYSVEYYLNDIRWFKAHFTVGR
ncbi:MAG: DarT ssDNA thymidine ADP-ribosyltransferase family protein, partial [Thermodesulfobacteriota bacterium]